MQNTVRHHTLTLIALLGFASYSSNAQQYGLMVAETAAPKTAEQIEVIAGIQGGDFSNLAGARGTYAYTEQLSFFGEATILEPDQSDTGFSFGTGATYAFLNVLPIDNAIRVAANLPLIPDTKAFSASASILLSGQLVVLPQTTFYTALGATYAEIEIEDTGVEGSDTFFNVSGGLFHEITEDVSVYAELSHVDQIFFGAGLRWKL
jgi:hypothetical protein